MRDRDGVEVEVEVDDEDDDGRERSLARIRSWGSVRGRVVGKTYWVFCGVSPVGVYSFKGAPVISWRRVESGI